MVEILERTQASPFFESAEISQQHAKAGLLPISALSNIHPSNGRDDATSLAGLSDFVPRPDRIERLHWWRNSCIPWIPGPRSGMVAVRSGALFDPRW